MIAFEWPLLVIILPLPWLLRRLLPASNPMQQAALKVPFLEDFADAEANSSVQIRQWPLFLATRPGACWC